MQKVGSRAAWLGMLGLVGCFDPSSGTASEGSSGSSGAPATTATGASSSRGSTSTRETDGSSDVGGSGPASTGVPATSGTGGTLGSTSVGGICAGQDGEPCGARVCASFSACQGDPANTCDETGTRTRTCTESTCMAGQCVEVDRVEVEDCALVTAGQPCQGGRTCEGEFGECEFDGHSTCDEAGTQSRTCIVRECVSGTCEVRFEPEVQECARTTEGTACDGGTTCDEFGGCEYPNVCAEAGIQSRSCIDRACSAGSCVASTPRIEERACSRDTDGATCGETSCGSFGSCVYDNTNFCDERGERTRTCTDRVCSAGTCGDRPRTDRGACERDTTGNVCQQGPTCCLAGECTQPCPS